MLKSIIKKILFKNKFLAKTFYHLRDELLIDRHLYKTPWGFLMSGNNEMQSGVFEPDETKIILNLLKDVDVFINIGANIGYYCLHALNLNKYVIAIEPNEINARKLMHNVVANNFEKNIELYQVAISSKVGIESLWGSGTGASLKKGWAGNSEFHSNLVPTNTLDNIISGRFENKKILILVDVEGYEYEVLIGAKSLCNRSKAPQWIIEITTTQNQPVVNSFNAYFKDSFEELYKYGYEAHIVGKDLRQISKIEIDEINNKKLSYLYHNFYFKKNDK